MPNLLDQVDRGTRLEGRRPPSGGFTRLKSRIIYQRAPGGEHHGPESITDNYDTLTLEQVYGAITYYLANRTEVDSLLRRNRAKFDALRLQARAAHPLLYQKLDEVQEVPSS